MNSQPSREPGWLGAGTWVRALGNLVSPRGRRGCLAILIYHRVLPEPDPLRPGEVSLAAFKWQMDTLAKGFNVLPLEEALEKLRREELPARSVVLTFDDGYADNYFRALPVLQHFDLPATFFVATGSLGRSMWNDAVIEAVRNAPASGLDAAFLGLGRVPTYDSRQRRDTLCQLLGELRRIPRSERDQAVTRLLKQAGIAFPSGLMMDREQIRELRNAGMGIGAHTVNHPILAHIPNDEAEKEIGESREALEEILGESVDFFAYPNGRPGQDYGPDHVAMAQRAGFKGALSTAWGVNRSKDSDRYQLRRFTPWDPTPERFACRLLWQCLKR